MLPKPEPGKSPQNAFGETRKYNKTEIPYGPDFYTQGVKKIDRFIPGRGNKPADRSKERLCFKNTMYFCYIITKYQYGVTIFNFQRRSHKVGRSIPPGI